MKEYTKEDFLKAQQEEDLEVITFNAYTKAMYSIKDGIEKAEVGDMSDDDVREMHILKSELGQFEAVKVLDNDFSEHFFMTRKRQVEFENLEKGEYGEILKAENGTYLNTDLNKALKREGSDYEIIKAQGHKYFKREPKAGGGYKYYYTESQYKKERGGEKKEDTGKEGKTELKQKLQDLSKLPITDKVLKEQKRIEDQLDKMK